MLLIKSQRATYVVAVAAALLLALCNESKPAAAQLALGGSEEISSTGIIGSMRHQANVAPVLQRNQLIKEEGIASVNAHTPTMHHQHQQLKANMKREAPAGPAQNASPESASKAAITSPLAQQQQQQKAADSSSSSTSKSADKSSPAQPSLKDKLKEHLNTASQAVASYSDQLAAQIPKRLRRGAPAEVGGAGLSYAQQVRERCIKLYAEPLEPPHNMSEEAHQKAKRIRERCNRYSGARLEEVKDFIDEDEKRQPAKPAAPTRSRRQAHPSGHSEHGANGNSYEHSYDHSYNHGQSYNNNYGNSNNHGNSNSHSFSNTPAHNGAAGSAGSQSKLAELGEKLNSARQLLQSVRERCAEGYVPSNEPNRNSNNNYNSEHRPLRRERESQVPESSERASKLGETFAGLRNKTNEVRQLVQSVRQQCAESLGAQARPNDHHRNQQQQHQQASPLVRHRRQAPAQNQAASALNAAAGAGASAHANGVESTLAAFGDQVSKQTSAAVQQINALRDQLVAGVSPLIGQQLPKRARRQSPVQVPASAPSLADINMAQANKPAVAQQHAELLGPSRPKRQIQYPSSGSEGLAPQTGTNGQSSGGGIMKYLSDLGQQAQQAEAIRQFVQAAGGSGSNQPKSALDGLSNGLSNPLAALANAASSSTSSTSSNVAQVIGQIADLIKSTHDRNAKVVESSQRSLDGAHQQTMDTVRNSQGGSQSTLAEMIQSLQKLTANNPNLLPDIKTISQAISSRLSSSGSSSAGQTAAANGNQLQDQLKQALQS